MTKPRTALRLLWLALAVAAWLTCFVMLVRFGTWFVFALAGTVLVALAFRFDPALLDLLRPSLAKVAIGFLLGAMMILLTHAALSLVTARWPEARTATFRLYTLLNAGGLPPSARAALVVVIATCEEILFRCVLTGSDPLADRNGLQHLLTWRSLGRVVVLAAC